MDDWRSDEELVTIYTPAYATKLCPVCGASMFADMDVCYACLGKQKEGLAKGDQQFALKIKTDALEVTVPLPAEGLVVGRGSTCDIVLNARSVSRQHVRIEPCDSGALVHDLGATNAAIVCGEELHGTRCMKIGDELRVCNTSIILQEGQADRLLVHEPFARSGIATF